MKKLISLFFIGTFLFVACTGTNIANMSEKERFINALTESTCAAFDIGIMNHEEVEANTFEIFEKYGFDADNEEEMMRLQEEYEADIEEPMMRAFEECATQEFIDMIEAFSLEDEQVETMEISEDDFMIEGDYDLSEFEDLDVELEGGLEFELE